MATPIYLRVHSSASGSVYAGLKNAVVEAAGSHWLGLVLISNERTERTIDPSDRSDERCVASAVTMLMDKDLLRDC